VIWQGLCGVSGGCRFGGVLSGQVIPADAKHLHDHAGAVSQRVDAGATAVSPGDGDFLHFEFQLSREEENLGIETPAFDFLQWEDRLNCRLLECFESALCVFEMQSEGEAQDQVEDPAEELAMQRLALRLGLGAQPARADGDIGAFFQRFEELGSFFEGRGEVGVAKQDDAAARVEHAIAHAVSLATVAGIFYQPECGILRGVSLNNVGRIVAGSVIDHDDFRIPSSGVDVAQHLLECRAQARALVVGGNHDAVSGLQKQFSVSVLSFQSG
jgi:hypothetical protein